MNLYFVANSMSHYNRLTQDYRDCRVKKILLNFIELSKLGEFSFDPSISYMIDSGAHTLQQPSKTWTNEELETFVKAYEIFVKKTCHVPCIKFYAEMDIDNIVGEDKVREWRERLSAITPKVVPVWHPTREKDISNPKEWIKYCKDYEWVSLGGSWKLGLPADYQFALVKYAYEQGTKVHAMGCTGFYHNLEVPFYSVDSSSWLSGEEHGLVPDFDFVKMKVVRVDYRKMYLAGTDYISRTKHTIKQYKHFERGMTDFWKSRGLDWDKMLEESNN
jgi:hypothetical protein